MPFSIAAIQHATRSGVIQCYDPDASTPLYNATAGACLGSDVPAEQITAVASSGSTTRTVVAEIVPQYLTPFQYGLNAKEKVKLDGGSCTDSYNSKIAPYNPAGAAGCSGGGSQGSVAVNSTDSDAIFNTSGTINGDVTVGVGGDPAVVVSSQNQVNGDINVASEPLEYPQVTVPSSLSCNSLMLNSGNTTIGPGETCYTTLQLTGPSTTLTTDGKVTIYITDKLQVTGGGIVNTGGDPSDLLILVTVDQNSNNVNYSAGNQFYGSIYAPDSTVNVSGGTEFYGAAVGKEIKFSGGSSAHFDLALMSETIDIVDSYKLFTWRAN